MSTLRRLLVVVVALVALGPGLQGQSPTTGQPALPKLEFEKYTLPNGLQVILHVDRKLPIVHVNEWFHVGSKNEKTGRTGFAHLFEHMMFQGSKNASEEYFVYAEKAGANIREGGVNGTTDFDRTNYFVTAPSGNLENLLWLESDRLATLLDATDIKKLDEQRNVVKNERRQGLENQPYGRWFELMFANAFQKGHPYSWPVIGSMEDLDGGLARRREGVLPPVLHAQQPVARDRRRFRPGRSQNARREVFRRSAAWLPAGPSGAQRATAGRRKSRRGERSGVPRAGLHRLADAGVFLGRGCGARHRGENPG